MGEKIVSQYSVIFPLHKHIIMHHLLSYYYSSISDVDVYSSLVEVFFSVYSMDLRDC